MAEAQKSSFCYVSISYPDQFLVYRNLISKRCVWQRLPAQLKTSMSPVRSSLGVPASDWSGSLMMTWVSLFFQVCIVSFCDVFFCWTSLFRSFVSIFLPRVLSIGIPMIFSSYKISQKLSKQANFHKVQNMPRGTVYKIWSF